ncbi:MAG: hypothetical protein GY790_23365, partial [Bacteroidetes bacterium]|nr:hypothetical protein [Bacteroidota bacterium]
MITTKTGISINNLKTLPAKIGTGKDCPAAISSIHRFFKSFLPAILLLVISHQISFSQTGPGGVGTSDGASNLSLWLDAGTITGISDGADMSGTWDDLSGNGYNALIGTAPSYSLTGGGNGMPALTFDQTAFEYMYVPGNVEIMPTIEVSVFVAGNYEGSSDNWCGIVSTADDDSWDDGWGIAQYDGDGEILFHVDDWGYGCSMNALDYGSDHVWNLIFNTADNRIYGYKSEDGCTDAFSGPIRNELGDNDDLLIGTAPNDGGPAYYLTGDIEEVIVYNVAVNDAQRIIISNYLAAKYDISLANNDVYDEDDIVNGDYDFDVAGIGRTDLNNIHDEAQGTGLVWILNPAGLEDNEFLLWGHDNGDALLSETTDIPAELDSRLDRVWRVSETGDVG